MNSLSKEQKKIISLLLLTILLLFLLWRFFYAPKTESLKQLKSTVDVGKAEIEAVYEMIGEEVSLEEAVTILKEKADKLAERRIRQKDISLALKGLSDFANKAGVRIRAIKPKSPEILTTEGGSTPTYGNIPCMKTEVAISLEGTYGQIAQYMYLLENSSRGIYTVEGFSIKKQKKDSSQLQIELLVWIYCFG